MPGTFYVVGVGPGDPELLTLKAIRVIEECDIIAVPVSGSDFLEVIYENENMKPLFPESLARCAAWQIVLHELPEILFKEKLYLPMPMMKEKDTLRHIHDEAARETAKWLDAGKNVAFITIGDPSVYSTGMYVHTRLKRKGYDTRIIPGIPSFCAAAARLDVPLAGNKEEIHIIPASYGVEEGLRLPGTKILMKAGKKMPLVKEEVQKRNLQIQMVENCGMKGERVYRSAEEIPDEASYYSLMIVREEG
ncbi:precorrin-2 C(20)-methyltransferase [Roseburia hominis]